MLWQIRRLHPVTRIPVTTFRLFVILAVISTFSCGFKLRGSLELSDDIAPLYIEQGSSFELATDIRSLLEKNNIALVEVASGANTTLVLSGENKSRRVLSVDSSGRASEYMLIYNVNVAIRHSQSRETQDTVTLTRSLLFDPDAVLAATNEAEILYRDMRKDAARLILLKLQARTTKPVATDNEKSSAHTGVDDAGDVDFHGQDKQ